MSVMEAVRARAGDALAPLRTAISGLGPGSVAENLHASAATFPGVIDQLWERSGPDGPIDVIDFFSGAGGMSAGFRLINGLFPAFSLKAAVDIDADANDSYRTNLGIKPHTADVAQLARDPESLDAFIAESGRRPGHPLVLIGCAPCQGFSSHRNAHGHDDARNGLFEDFSDVAVALQPDLVIMENVPELCATGYWPHVEYTIGRLRGAGYLAHLSVHNMAEFGVPQERFRAVLFASKAPFHLPRPTHTRGSFRTVRDAIAYLPPVAPGEQHPDDPQHRTAGHKASTIETIRAVPHNGGNRSATGGPRSLSALKERQGKAGYEDVYGRLWWDRPSITITAYSRNPASGRFIHPEQDRGLSVREAALLQGFPATYAFDGGFDSRFRQVGNAVPPLFAAHLAVAVLASLLDPPAGQAPSGIESPLAMSFARLIPALKAGTAVLPGAPA